MFATQSRGFAPQKQAPISRLMAAEAKDVVIDCGWGRLILAHTFGDPADMVHALLSEEPGKRDVAFNVADPHVALSLAPFDMFLDPSHSYRLDLSGAVQPPVTPGYRLRLLASEQDVEEVNRICAARGMVQIDAEFALETRDPDVVAYLLAEAEGSGAIIGAATGIDHVRAYGDPEEGSSLWSLAVDPQALEPGIGEALVRGLARRFRELGRSYMDLSVLHSNAHAIALYEKIGFERRPTFTLKTKNSFNEKLFIGPTPESRLNPYAQIITDEARRRGIAIDIVDEDACMFRLSLGGRSVLCRESLCSLASATAMAICDDKALTRRVVQRAGLMVPDQCVADDEAAVSSFLDRHPSVVVKPARGEQGRGIAVDLSSPEEVMAAVERARQHCETVLLEEFVSGHDVRIVVIDFKMVAAAVRRPAEIIGTGQHDVRCLIEKQSRRRAAATGGESNIPMDAETERCLQKQGLTMDMILPRGSRVQVRKTANLHTGGTIHDITEDISPVLAEAAVTAAKAIDIPVVGLDLIVPDIGGERYWIIEANERPGLANHEPRPTAEAFVTMLFPQTAPSLIAKKA